MRCRLLIALLCAALCGPLSVAASNNVTTDGLAWIQISDIHVDPHLSRQGAPGASRGAKTIRWICETAHQPQKLDPFDITTPPPTFAIATGDLTEYGVIDDTWRIFEKAFANLGMPLYVLPGNHDNTWNALYQVMRRRYGGENHSFDRGGIHFVCISSASPQEPVPTIDARTRAWLQNDLASIGAATPVVLALHHPPDSGELAPAEEGTFFDMLHDHNVVLILCGHGHSVWHKEMEGVDVVMGGSTFGKNAGYAVYSVQDGRLRAVYRYHRPGKADKPPVIAPLLDKPLANHAPRRLLAPIDVEHDIKVTDKAVEIHVVPLEHAKIKELSFAIDGQEPAQAEDKPGLDASTGLHRRLPLGDLPAGMHLLSVHATAHDGAVDIRTATFRIDNPTVQVAWRREFPAAFKAGPAVAGDLLIVAGTDGRIRALDKETSASRWEHQVGAEILGTPALTDGRLVFGDGTGGICALDPTNGQVHWKASTPSPVYGAPLIANGTVYVGDSGGRLHAFDLATGEHKWTFERADYTIECQPAPFGDLIVFGAWDGYLYAVNRSNGTPAWKSLGPKSSEGGAARYYAPADCGPVAIGDKLFVCDRGYLLGAFDNRGAMQQKWDLKISAIATGQSADRLYARTLDDKHLALDPTGQPAWTTSVPAGRFPIPPTVTAERIYLCSNTGLLSALSADTGQVLWQYQVTPGFYVMAPVAVDKAVSGDQATCYVAGMNGSVTALAPRTPTHSSEQ